MPVILCQPLSLLQRINESLQYSELLNKTFDESDPSKRLAYIAAYAISGCSSIERLSKPFNPLLGETYELIRLRFKKFNNIFFNILKKLCVFELIKGRYGLPINRRASFPSCKIGFFIIEYFNFNCF